MFSKLASSVFAAIPEIRMKQHFRALLHRQRHKEYKTYYKNNLWELHYPDFILRYKDVPTPASSNYLLLQKFVDRDFNIIIDAGGFMGTYGFYMAKKYPKAKIYIFEADPINYRRIKENLAVNDLTNVTVEELGLWKNSGVLQMSVSSDLSSSVINMSEKHEAISIKVTSLDEYFSGVKDKLVFVKMNIEGAEIAALNGGENFIRNNKVDLNICADHYVDGKLTHTEVENIFARMGMKTETLLQNNGRYINVISTNISRN